MVQALINLNEHEATVLNIIKAKFGLKNKSAAVNMILKDYEQEFLEPELRPEYEKELEQIDKGKFHRFSNIAELRKILEKQ